MAMPTTTFWDNDFLAKAVNENNLNRTRLVDMATRIVATWYQFGQDSPDFPKTGVGMPPDLLKPHEYIDAKDPASKQCLVQQAIEGHVLVKNTNNVLPLNKPKVLSVFGYDAPVQVHYMPGQADWAQNREMLGLQQPQEQQLAANKPLSDAPQTAMGVLIVGGGSGSNTPAYISSPWDALQARAYDDDTALFYDFSSLEPSVVAASDVCLVFINAYASEAWDRPGLADDDSDNLITSVARQCNNTIVVIHNAGIRLVDGFIDHPNVTAVMFAHLPGQDAGRSVVQLLYGDVSPSGRLPYTVAKKASDYGRLQGPCEDDSHSPQCDYTEGVNIDYRSFLARNVAPRFAFGYGLTYTTFQYSSLTINLNATSTANAVSTAGIYTMGTTNQNAGRKDVGVGGLLSLYESMGSITATVKNNGAVAAAEVAQLYLEIPVPDAATKGMANTRVLRGFGKVMLQPGQDTQVQFALRRKDISYWDVGNQTWIAPGGKYQVYVGQSVLDTPLVGSFQLD
ncbi:glycoside hydrolase family 3 protein [Dothistroma septosporum NZE10]|uniref:beta-glucosidase n=1 Tax=Dothistroma septosporum (strain NZE10 / CBS 128990) TaxID=675120 RepID=M2YL63_DOTSN|nr:glycoside hydrolase family 3 protein [Dothistroma septosporum NZE10]